MQNQLRDFLESFINEDADAASLLNVAIANKTRKLVEQDFGDGFGTSPDYEGSDVEFNRIEDDVVYDVAFGVDDSKGTVTIACRQQVASNEESGGMDAPDSSTDVMYGEILEPYAKSEIVLTSGQYATANYLKTFDLRGIDGFIEQYTDEDIMDWVTDAAYGNEGVDLNLSARIYRAIVDSLKQKQHYQP